jgi:hypothetical protein
MDGVAGCNRTPEQGRDLVAGFVAQAYDLPLPDEWLEQRDSGSGASRVTTLFTGGPWVVRVSYAPGAPLIGEFEVTLDHLTAVMRWQGRVDSQGHIAGKFVSSSLPTTTIEAVDGWVGTIAGLEPGAQYDDYFQLLNQNGSRYGIDSTDETLSAQLADYRNTGTLLRVWGTLQRDVPDVSGMQIVVTRIEPYQP